jgi:hypothetical protein
MIRLITSVLAISGLMACQSSTNAGETQAQPAEVAADIAGSSAMEIIPASGLGPQDLLPGECGLFLWSKTDISKFIFFSKAQTGQATFAQGAEPASLAQTNAGGDIFGQFNTLSSYKFEDGKNLSLSIGPGEELDGGQRIENGLVTITDLEGWVTKLPVVGVRACKPEE